MIITPQEYSEKFLFKGKKVSVKTVIRRCDEGMLPSHHHARKLPGGDWVIEIADETPSEIIATKLNPPKPDLKSLNRKYYSFR